MELSDTSHSMHDSKRLLPTPSYLGDLNSYGSGHERCTFLAVIDH